MSALQREQPPGHGGEERKDRQGPAEESTRGLSRGKGLVDDVP